MYRVTREIHFCYGHRLLNYDGKCRHLHGHNGKAVITIEAPQLDRLGMVMDFSRIKKVVSAWIDETLDHKMLLHKDDPVLDYLRQQGEPVHVLDVNPTAENLARLIPAPLRPAELVAILLGAPPPLPGGEPPARRCFRCAGANLAYVSPADNFTNSTILYHTVSRRDSQISKCERNGP